MNSINIMGRMVADTEIRQTNSGKKVISFRIAVDAGKDKEAYFFACTAWNTTAENIAKYFHKGDKIAISGILTSRSYEVDGRRTSVVEILVNSFDFCNVKPEKATTAPYEEPQPQPQPQPQPLGGLPFEV